MDVTCPHCGENIDTYPDLGGGEDQEYLEDCSVCCRPIVFHARWDEITNEYRVDVSGDV